MKKLIYICFLFLFFGCIFTYDPPRAKFNVYNNSNDAVYVYEEDGNADSLPLLPSLCSLAFMDAYKNQRFTMLGTPEKPDLPDGINSITLFFISEKTLRSYDLREIYKGQIIIKRITLTKKELINNNWEYTYMP